MIKNHYTDEPTIHYSQDLNYRYPHYFLKESYFKSGTFNILKRLESIELQSKNIPTTEIFGQFIDQQHYISSVNLLLDSSLETEHRYEIIEREILPKVSCPYNMLDIGIGNGELSKFVGQHFSNITAVDISDVSLANLPDYHWNSGIKMTKIVGSILDVELSAEHYDLILLSHIIYYIPQDIRNNLINELYDSLNPQGKLVIIYNGAGNRYDLTNHFHGTTFNFTDMELSLNNYSNVKMYASKEIMHTVSIDSMLIVAGVCLVDASTSASKNDLTEYLNLFHHEEDGYYINMMHKVIVIEKEWG